ncbi:MULTISPECIES: PAS domain S-box protein [unclassified Sinorhizobium]|uniref:PAS domain S-box protein n=1 Tax=unclassified Sinorhizobium TaxID=2613772 RepID=UPI0035263ABB
MRIGNIAASDLRSVFQEALELQAAPDLVEKLPVAIYACDAQGRILWFNERAAALWGRMPAIGSNSERYCGSYKFYFNGRQITREETPVATVLRSGIPIRGIEAKIERPDGSSIWAMVYVEPVVDQDGHVIGAIICFHDITERIHAGEVIRQQDQRLAATYDHAGIGIAEVSADGKLQRVNAHIADLLGYPPHELVGRSIFDPILADGAEIDEREFQRQVRGEIDRYNVEKRFIRKDGTKIWIAVTSSSVKDAQGRFLYAVRVQHDVTARKQAEAALVRHVEEQAALYEFTDGLQRAGTLDQVHQLALNSIKRALRCDRAAILLFDEAGTLKFVASHGLSQSYQLAVEGHSPWSQDSADPEPICINDIEQADLPQTLKVAIGGEGISGIGFIPIVSRGRLLGKFMTYYDRPHAFTASEVRLALTVARQLGFAVERVRIETARQWAERAANQLVAIVESSHDAIISKNLDGVITSWNKSAERLFGYRADEAIGKPITMIIPVDRLDEEPVILSRIRSGERVDHFETVRRRKNGTLVDISLTISPIRDNRGRIIGASKIARDITERKAAEAKLRASERQMRDLLAAIPAAIYTTDAEGRITYFNQAAVELAGRTPEIGSDKWCVTWKLHWPDGTPLPHDQCPMAIALKEGRIVRGVEAVAERPDGVRIPFIPYPTPLRDESGTIVGGINMLVDVSERKQAETQLRLLFNELNHRVKNNMQMLQSLLNLAGHKTDNAEARRILRDASERVAAMAAAQQVLYGTTNATQFSAKELVRAVSETARQSFPEGVTIRCKTDDVVLANDTAMPLALILNELLTNAVKYGGGDRERIVDVGLLQTDGKICLYVEDDGPGFDLASVRDRSSGLKLVQGLARQVGGQFSVTMEPRTRCSIQFF